MAVVCSHCAKLHATGFCKHCRVAMYCSESCATADWEPPTGTHARVCQHLRQAGPESAMPLGLFGLGGSKDEIDLKDQLLRMLHSKRLDAFQALANLVVKEDKQVTPITPENPEFAKERSASEKAPSQGENYWYSLNADADEFNEAEEDIFRADQASGAPRTRIYPHGPAPGVYTINCPDYPSDMDDRPRPPFKRALAQLMLSYWADAETTSDPTLTAENLMPNIPYVRQIYSAVAGSRRGIFLSTNIPPSTTMPLEELLGEYGSMANPSIRSERGTALLGKLGIAPLAATSESLFRYLGSEDNIRKIFPSVLVQEALADIFSKTQIPAVRGPAPTQRAISVQTMEAFKRLFAVAPDIATAHDVTLSNLIHNIITQVIYTLWFLQRNFECTLANLTVPNIYVAYEDPKVTPIFKYHIGNTTLEVKNMGVRVVLPNLEYATFIVPLAIKERPASDMVITKTKAIFAITSVKSMQRALVEHLLPIPEARDFSAQLSPSRFDPTRDLNMFFNSLSLEPRWGIHRLAIVAHFLGHEELAHVRAFGDNRLFKRVSLDYSVVFGFVRQKSEEWVNSYVSQALGTMSAQLLHMSDRLGIPSHIQSELIHSFKALLDMRNDYKLALTSKTNTSPREVAIEVLTSNTARTRALLASMIYIKEYLGGEKTDIREWGIFARMKVVLASLGKMTRSTVSIMWAAAFGESDQTIAALVPLLVPGAETDSVVDYIAKNTLRHVMTRYGSIKTAMEANAPFSRDDIRELAREISRLFVESIGARYILDTARSALMRHVRALLSRGAIMSGAAVPTSSSFGVFKTPVSDMNKFIEHIGAVSREILRPTTPIISKRKEAIRREMPDLIKLLEAAATAATDEANATEEKTAEAKVPDAKTKETKVPDAKTKDAKLKEATTIRDFTAMRTLAGMITAADIRTAAYGNPTQFVRWFADAAQIKEESPVLRTLLKNKEMRFGAGAQGYVYGYEDKEGFVAVKFTNPLREVSSMRPMEMNSSGLVSSPQINEVIVSSIASDLFERGISPHFIKFHGCMITKVQSRNAFIGSTGYEDKKIETLVDELVIDLLEKDHHSTGLTGMLTNVASVLAILVLEWAIAMPVINASSSIHEMIGFVLKMLTVLQRSTFDVGGIVSDSPMGKIASSIQQIHNEAVQAANTVTNLFPSTNSSPSKTQTEETTAVPAEKPIYDGASLFRVIGLQRLFNWVGHLNPMLLLLMIDTVRRVMQLGDGVTRPSRGEGSMHIHEGPAQVLRVFAAYKTQGTSALPPRIRAELAVLTQAFDSTGSYAETAKKEGKHETAPMFQMVSTMEAIDGDFMNFDRIVVLLQNKILEENKEKFGTSWHTQIPTIEEYVDNAITQVVFALAQFHTYLSGMHMDFHAENVFIKLCDNTLFNGKPLLEHEYFTYVLQGNTYQVKNMGFVVKLGDLGHASLNLQRTAYAKAGAPIDITQPQASAPNEYQQGKNRLVIHKAAPQGIEAMFAYDIAPLRYIINTVAEAAPEWIPAGSNVADFANKIVSNLWVRHLGAFMPAYDLGHFMNACAMLPFTYRSKIVHAYHTTERLRWIQTYGNMDGMPQYSPNSYLPMFIKFTHPIAEKQITTPLEFVTADPVFDVTRIKKK